MSHLHKQNTAIKWLFRIICQTIANYNINIHIHLLATYYVTMFFEPFWKGNLIQFTVLRQFLGPHWGLKSVLCSRQPIWGFGHVGLRLLHWLFDAKTCASGWPREKQMWDCKFRLPVWWMVVSTLERCPWVCPNWIKVLEKRWWGHPKVLDLLVFPHQWNTPMLLQVLGFFRFWPSYLRIRKHTSGHCVCFLMIFLKGILLEHVLFLFSRWLIQCKP